MLIHKTMFLKFVGVTPSQLAKLHEFCNSSRSRLPYLLPDAQNEDYDSKPDGTSCVFVKDAKFDAIAETYTVQVKVYTEFFVMSYTTLEGTKVELPEKAINQGFLLTPPHSVLDNLYQALELFWHISVVKVKDFRSQRLM